MTNLRTYKSSMVTYRRASLNWPRPADHHHVAKYTILYDIMSDCGNKTVRNMTDSRQRLFF